MKNGQLPIAALPAWCVRNNIELHDVKPTNFKKKGNGLIAEGQMESVVDTKTLLAIPENVILSVGYVERYAAENHLFRELAEAVGYQSPRQYILLFLLMQLILSSPDCKTSHETKSTPWTEYICFMPSDVPVPTMWLSAELSLLRTTSLESVVAAKLELLTREFQYIQARSKKLPFWHETLSSTITMQDWVWLDALWRSRSFDLPYSGESMVPCLDIPNHSNRSTSYFQQDASSKTVTLLLRNGCSVAGGDEITINYGKDKPAAEMLFNYGFIDLESTTHSAVLPLDEIIAEDQTDPFMREKAHAFNGLPTLELAITEKDIARWTSPFIHLMSVHEQDGLTFSTEERNECKYLNMWWQGANVTNMARSFSVLTNVHPLRDVFEYRAMTTVLRIIKNHLEKAQLESTCSDVEMVSPAVRKEVKRAALQLRSIEQDIIEKCLQSLNKRQRQLLQDESVQNDLISP